MANGDKALYQTLVGSSKHYRAHTDGILGQMSEAAATGAVGTTKSVIAYLKQLVTVAIADGADIDAIRDAIYGTAGISSFPAGTQAADGVSLAEVLRYVQEHVDTLETIQGTRFTIIKSIVGTDIPQNLQTVPLTQASSGLLILEGISILHDATGWDNAGGQNIQLSFNNVKGSNAAGVPVLTVLEADCGAQETTISVNANAVLESGKIVYIHKSAAAALLAGNSDVHLHFRRLANGATILPVV